MQQIQRNYAGLKITAHLVQLEQIMNGKIQEGQNLTAASQVPEHRQDKVLPAIPAVSTTKVSGETM